MKKITKDTSLAKVLEHSGTEKILAKHNVPCVICPFVKMEMDKLKISQICKIYGINAEKLLMELNKKA